MFGNKQRELPAEFKPPNPCGVICGFIFGFSITSTVLTFRLGVAALFFSFLVVLILGWCAAFPFRRSYPSAHHLFAIGFVVCGLGFGLGISNYHTNYAIYFSSEAAREYDGVSVATAKAGAYRDGGIIFFTDGKLDDSRSIGWKGIDHVYCVAPVVADFAANASATDPDKAQVVQFWAIGYDCCGARTHYDCDGAGEFDSKGGLVYHSPEEHLTSHILAPASDYDAFMHAVHSAVALHTGLETAETPVLVKWVADPVETMEFYRRRAILQCMISSGVITVIVTIMWIVIHTYYDNQVRMALARQSAQTTFAPDQFQSAAQRQSRPGPATSQLLKESYQSGRLNSDPFLKEDRQAFAAP